MEKRYCIKCGKPILKGRLEALPDTTTCVKCSEVVPRSIYDVDIEVSDPADMYHNIDSDTSKNLSER